MKKTMKINTIKGFTIPPGYTLQITKDDGSVDEKQPGEQSGSNYSFQEVLSGVDPDWQLIQQNGGAAPEVTPSYYYYDDEEEEEDTPNLMVNDLMFRKKEHSLEVFEHLVTKFDPEYLSKHLSEDIVEVLGGLSRDMRKALFVETNGDYEKLNELGKDYILTHPFLDKLGGYMTNDDMIADAHKLLDHVQRNNIDTNLIALETALLLEWKELKPQTREILYDNDEDKFLKDNLASYNPYYDIFDFTYHPSVTDTSFETAKFSGRSAISVLEEYLPSFYADGTVSYDEIENLLAQLQNPEDAYRVISNLPVINYYTPHMLEERERKIEQFERDGTLGNKIHDKLVSLDIQIDENNERRLELVEQYEAYLNSSASTEEKAEFSRTVREELAKISQKGAELTKLSHEIQYSVITAVRRVIASQGAKEADQYSEDGNYTTNENTAENINNIQSALSFIFGFVHPTNRKNIGRLHFNYEEGVRAYYKRKGVNGASNVVIRPQDSIYTLVHELGHHLEARNGAIQHLVSRVLADRISPDETYKLMSEATEDSWYSDDEITFVDNFHHPYVGKYYGHADIDKYNTFKDMVLEKSSGYSEIISMGLEFMCRNPKSFANKDPELFKAIWKLRNPLKMFRDRL
jgi:hypothetical protein